jgi:hypothetical protein
MLWLMPPGRPSLLGAITTSMNYRTLSTPSCLSKRRTNSRPLVVKKDVPIMDIVYH